MEKTITSISTPLGEGGIGIIRISGEKSFDILSCIFVDKNKKKVLTKEFKATEIEKYNRKLLYGHIINPKTNQTLDQVLVAFMKGPYTYTTEDVVEINCHGSMLALKNILSLVLEQGAFLAEPGEFTKRAFLNGRIDLSQAEAVIDLIKAKSDKGYDIAINQLEGGLSQEIKIMKNKLVSLLSTIVVNIEYPDEDIEQITYEHLKEEIIEINEILSQFLKNSEAGKVIKEGLRTAIIGRPNVGKSSLMNVLLKESRAIVTDIPGTTRDSIEEEIIIKGIPLKIIDTAGIRKTDDPIEKIGVERSKAYFNTSDLIIFMINGAEPLAEEDIEIIDYISDKQAIIMINKADLKQKINLEEIKNQLPNKIIIQSALKEETGIKELENAIESLVFKEGFLKNETTFMTNIRQIDLVKKASSFLDDAVNAVDSGMALDFVEVDIKEAADALGEIIGESVTEDVISLVFENFCLGK